MLEYEGPLLHWCEVCGVEAFLTPVAAHEAGWDFPPLMGWFGVVCPRTCPDCKLADTAWWQLAVAQTATSALDPRHVRTIERIVRERPRKPG